MFYALGPNAHLKTPSVAESRVSGAVLAGCGEAAMLLLAELWRQ